MSSSLLVPEVDGKMDQDHHDTGYFAVSSTADLTPMKRAGSSTEKERDGRATWLLVLSGMATTFGASLPVGYNIGVINAPSAVIQKWCSEALLQRYSITLTPATLAIVWSTIVSIFLIGGMIGSLAGSWFAHQIGRKGTLIVSGVLGVVAGILFLTCKDPHLIEFIFIGRFLVGLSSGLITGVMPMYLCEIAPPNLRGVMGVLCPLGLTFGVVFSQFMGMNWILGTEQHWHHLLALYAILIIFCGLALPFMPESPKYLYYIKGLKQRACRGLIET
ncbi:solute carrier family 2, facilitated glucose transporter member 5-like [Nilaparvata lugens]|uniref:solute carrier family 2, facilitated glucose transporter member 5-like n=1 Tax=Nilaparvata lugens TaxID=108931 RepID=UPI00193D33ED|nr:solute carrier family 2, facilitated glucose transporter member 5-like [Nilaparvata lugens]